MSINAKNIFSRIQQPFLIKSLRKITVEGNHLNMFKINKTQRAKMQWQTTKPISIKNRIAGTSLVVQWLRICLPVQGTWVRALVQEDPTCHRATEPVRRNY